VTHALYSLAGLTLLVAASLYAAPPQMLKRTLPQIFQAAQQRRLRIDWKWHVLAISGTTLCILGSCSH